MSWRRLVACLVVLGAPAVCHAWVNSYAPRIFLHLTHPITKGIANWFARKETPMFRNCLAVLALLTLLIPAAGEAAPFDNRPKILLHLTHPTTKGVLCDRGLITDCQEAVVNGDLYPNGKSYFLFVEVAKGGSMNSAGGVQLSIDYDAAPGSGVDVFGWTYCVDAHYSASGPHGAWPAAQSNNRLIWNVETNCQTGPVAIAGYFYLAAYSPDVFRVLPWFGQSNGSVVANCDAREFELGTGEIGRVAFSSGAATPGCNPCVENCNTPTPQGNPIKPDLTPVREETWSAIKALYQSSR